jgi:HK97 family phage prohead protease
MATRERVFKAEIRASQDGTKLVGRAIVYNSAYEDLGFTEFIDPGAFYKSLRENQAIKAFWNHNSDIVIASRANETLRLTDGPGGLDFEADTTPEFRATPYFAALQRGDVDQCSFMFQTVQDKWSFANSGDATRHVTEAKLFEISPVALPAYTATSVGVRDRVQDLTASLERRSKRLAGGGELSKDEKDELRAIWRAVDATISINGDHLGEPDVGQSTQNEPDSRDSTPDGESRGAIPFHAYPLAGEGVKWDANEEVTAANVDDLKKMCAWYDAKTPEAKGSYRFPHHLHNQGYATVKAAVDNAMARLSDSDIPEADKPKVKTHLEKHQAEFEEQKKADDGRALLEGERRRLEELRVLIIRMET